MHLSINPNQPFSCAKGLAARLQSFRAVLEQISLTVLKRLKPSNNRPFYFNHGYSFKIIFIDLLLMAIADPLHLRVLYLRLLRVVLQVRRSFNQPEEHLRVCHHLRWHPILLISRNQIWNQNWKKKVVPRYGQDQFPVVLWQEMFQRPCQHTVNHLLHHHMLPTHQSTHQLCPFMDSMIIWCITRSLTELDKEMQVSTMLLFLFPYQWDTIQP